MGDTEGAIREYRLAIGVAPDYFEAHLKLAQLLLARGDTSARRRTCAKPPRAPTPASAPPPATPPPRARNTRICS